MIKDESTDPFRPNQADFANIGRGILMGGADVIPGVSGGTIALILGIYERLVTAVSHFDPILISHVTKKNFRQAAQHADFRFLLFLGIGILSGAVALGAVMHTLLEDYRQYTMAAFFGMIGASCYLVAKLIERWKPKEGACLVAGALFAYWLVGQPALENPPDALWYVFICGAIAICAMILPGISGSFILLILGKYHEVTGVIKEVVKLKLSVHSILLVGTFASGCLVGLISFSKLLRWLLAKKFSVTMATLCGFMIGSLYKIWPFQIDTTPEIEEFKHKKFEIVPFNEIQFDGRFAMTVGIAISAAIFVLVLERFGQSTHKPDLKAEDESASTSS